MRRALKLFVFISTIGVLLIRYLYDQLKVYENVVHGRGGETMVKQRNQTVCPDYEFLEHGPITVSSNVPTWNELEKRFPEVKIGGSFVPYNCHARHKIGVIVPYRNREDHLKLYLQHMYPSLQRQNLEYTTYVIELEQEGLFKKTLLMNAGFLEVSKMSKNTSCFVFHDVDMLPQHSGISYACDVSDVKHPTVYVKQFNYKLSKVRTHIFEPGNDALRYMSWEHERQPVIENRHRFYLRAVERMYEDGLNSARYHLLKREKKPLYTWLLIASNLTDASYKNIKPKYVSNDKY